MTDDTERTTEELLALAKHWERQYRVVLAERDLLRARLDRYNPDALCEIKDKTGRSVAVVERHGVLFEDEHGDLYMTENEGPRLDTGGSND